ncbi:molybdenum ABC transporter ATP-binding protein [Microbaculum marinum]|uniref:Molybdenum ABC transporter ATP-binding protein n=1 Tax=Microbaculum marinum TaxID=1764581 RepID=A0AAW9RUL2_9HYPH
MSITVSFRHRFAGFDLDVEFEPSSRGIVALFGPSGAGKSTTVNAIAGLLRPAQGRIVFGDRVLLDTDRGIFVPPRKRRIGYVFQDARLFPHMSVRDNLLYGWRRSANRPPKQEIDRVIGLLGLDTLLQRRPRFLSGGEKSRVALGRALLCGPDLLLLDEPLANLDQARRNEILPYLERLREEMTVPMVYVSHSIDEVTRLSDTIVVLNGGKVVAAGEVGDIMTRLDLFPITGRFEAGAVIDATVAGHDGEFGLTTLAVDGARLVVPELSAREGSQVRVRIRARDVIIALSAPVDTSANNILPATITDIRFDPGPYADVLLHAAGTPLLARVTRSSIARLGLASGTAVFAVIKAINVEPRGRSGQR